MKKILVSLLAIILLVGCEDAPKEENNIGQVEISDSQVVQKYLMWKDNTFKSEEEELAARPTKEEFKRLKQLDVNNDGKITAGDYVKLCNMGR